MNTLHKIRVDHGLTQEQVARYLGLSAKTPYNWEQLPDEKVKPFQRIAYEKAAEDLETTRRFGCIHGSPPTRYTQLSWVGGSHDNYDTPHVALDGAA